MKFTPFIPTDIIPEDLEAEYKAAREIGVVRIGEDHLFFRTLMKRFFVSYGDVRRCFRRQVSSPAKMCCGRGEFIDEFLVLADGEEELIQIKLPSEKAAVALMKELKARMPQTDFTAPMRPKAETS